MYQKETELMEDLLAYLKSPGSYYSFVQYVPEFQWANGRADLVIQLDNNHLVAFETKLAHWRKAFQQAYRNTSFAHMSYVILPSNKRSLLIKNITLFERYGIGIGTMSSNGQLDIILYSRRHTPTQIWATRLVKENLKAGSETYAAV